MKKDPVNLSLAKRRKKTPTAKDFNFQFSTNKTVSQSFILVKVAFTMVSRILEFSEVANP